MNIDLTFIDCASIVNALHTEAKRYVALALGVRRIRGSAYKGLLQMAKDRCRLAKRVNALGKADRDQIFALDDVWFNAPSQAA